MLAESKNLILQFVAFKRNCSVLPSVFWVYFDFVSFLFCCDGVFCLFIQIGLETMRLCVNRWWLNVQAIGRNVLAAQWLLVYSNEVYSVSKNLAGEWNVWTNELWKSTKEWNALCTNEPWVSLVEWYVHGTKVVMLCTYDTFVLFLVLLSIGDRERERGRPFQLRCNNWNVLCACFSLSPSLDSIQRIL